MAKVLMAMSGGVDSSVAAQMLQAEGHEVIGAFLRLGEGGHAAEKSKATALEVEAVQMRARLATALQDTKKYRSNDARLHTMLVESNRELQEEKLKVEELEVALDTERARAETAEADAVVQVEAVEERMAESVGRANQRAADLLEELKGSASARHCPKAAAAAPKPRP